MIQTLDFYQLGREYHGEDHHSYENAEDAWEALNDERGPLPTEGFERFEDGFDDQYDEVLNRE